MGLKKTAKKIGWKGDLSGLQEVSSILFEEGFERVVDKLHLKPCISWRCRFHCMFRKGLCAVHLEKELSFEERFVRTLERLGPWILVSSLWIISGILTFNGALPEAIAGLSWASLIGFLVSAAGTLFLWRLR